MATKSQMFRRDAQRKGGGVRKPQKRAPGIDPKHTNSRNVSKRIDKQVGMALEDSESGRPSRKSTRPSAHGGRNDVTLMKTARDASMTPKARAKRSQSARR